MGESEDPQLPGSLRTTRRRFLALTGVAAAGLLAGCAPKGAAGPNVTTTVNKAAMGPEPSAFEPPQVKTKPRPLADDPTIVETDVCVVGGGAAGIAAATCAARLGLRTVLLEESYILGGNVTRGLVNLDKVSWGGPIMVRGYFEELLRTLVAEDHAVFPSSITHWSVRYDTDALRHAALVIARRAEVDVRLAARAVWVERFGQRISALWATEQGRDLVIKASHYVDCTGDGTLGYMAGNTYWYGDRKYGQVQGQTLIFHVAPVDFAKLKAFAERNGSNVNDTQVIGLRSTMKSLRASGRVEGTPQWGMLINLLMSPNTISISASETYGEHLEPGSVPKIMTILERQDYQIHAGLKTDVPGFEDSHIIRLAERPYLREGRRLTGYYQLTAEDVLGAKKPSDSVARGWYPIDLHVPYTGEPAHLGELKPGDYYGIPYRCLVARNVDNLLMAGRCISVTHEALGSTRISPTSMAIGQAAGIAAALSADKKIKPADLPAGEVQQEVTKQGGLY